MFSTQNADAALLHGADVKEMIEEPMKVTIAKPRIFLDKQSKFDIV